MAFYANIGYKFKMPGIVAPTGSVVLASAIPMHQLDRRKINARYRHMRQRRFDPQLYLAGLDPNRAARHCANLATYPWFGVSGLQEYRSAEQKQASWRKCAKEKISGIWPREAPDDPGKYRNALHECVEYQLANGYEAIILPSPLTDDPSTSYDRELAWLDEGLHCVTEARRSQIPIYATVALADVCVRRLSPKDNPLLEMIADSISAREVDGVYLVLEQGAEPGEARSCEDSRSLHSALTLVHYLAKDAEMAVSVNFFGPFGLALRAAGADLWASGWYKSTYRLRLEDKLAEGRAFPSYWNYQTALDIHLENDFDRLRVDALIPLIEDMTPASGSLLSAAQKGLSPNDVPSWRYSQSNVEAAREHFYYSAMHAEFVHSRVDGPARLDRVSAWLDQAARSTSTIAQCLGIEAKTRMIHPLAWNDAFQMYRRDQGV